MMIHLTDDQLYEIINHVMSVPGEFREEQRIQNAVAQVRMLITDFREKEYMANWKRLTEIHTKLLRTLHERLREKGTALFNGPHEIMGILEEEVREYKDAVHMNNNSDQMKEMYDIGVTVLWGITSMVAFQEEGGRNE